MVDEYQLELTEQPLLTPDFYRTAAIARRSDPATSREAARSLGDLTGRQLAVYSLCCAMENAYGYTFLPPMSLILDGFTDGDVAALYAICRTEHRHVVRPSGECTPLPPQSPSGLRTRRAELVDAGLVASTPRTRSHLNADGVSSRPMTVWRVIR